MQKQHYIIIDLLLVALFAAIGRASHDGSLTPQGIFSTAWPFLTACLVAWAVMLIRKRPSLTWGGGIFVWIVTVAGGMVLRRAMGGGTAIPFVIVATGTLALFLLGWRLIVRQLRSRSDARSQSWAD